MKKYITFLCCLVMLGYAMADTRIFAIYNRSLEDSIAINAKYHRQLRKVFTNYWGVYYQETDNTNILWMPIGGGQHTRCWDSMKRWTNVAGTISVDWWHALPAETNGIPLKKIVLDQIEKDKIIDFMATNSCIRTNLPNDHKIITNSTVVYTWGE